jgi:hypothetical protein
MDNGAKLIISLVCFFSVLLIGIIELGESSIAKIGGYSALIIGWVFLIWGLVS